MGRYFPLSKAAKLRQEISAFKQGESETLFEVYERFKNLLRRCPHHGFASWMQVQIIYNGLNYATHQLIDAAVHGSLSNKYPDKVEQHFESMPSNESHWASKGTPQKRAGIYEVSSNDALAAKVDLLSYNLDMLMGSISKSKSVMSCSTCGGGHEVEIPPKLLMESIATTKAAPSQGTQVQQPILEKRLNTEDVLTKFMINTESSEIGSILTNLQASVQSLEHQMGQLAKENSKKPSGSLPSNTEENPREHLKAIALRNGRQVEIMVELEPSVMETGVAEV
ncbi:uncharacterized protein LOC120257383 [Dioscorea cayenensis subsp. rotundata]|uniref:Uncharacterized protein LOC120257383 n=1 Tax=Dioscorea cayennensis subsp. rotundata TaxID=55577 RepID=A0AB40B190_DIOCR|nr:uncharacterized protein LOC120257383 [Dioscorea cayenensis subsp. rotundata]